MSIKTELARLRRLVEEKVAAVRPKEIFRLVTVFEGVPLSEGQQRDLDYNCSLKEPLRVGFMVIRIQRQVECHLREVVRAEIEEGNALEH